MRISDWSSDVCSSDLSEASRDKIPFSTRRRPTDERSAIHGSIVLIDPAIFDGTSFEIIRQPVPDILKIFALLINMARRECASGDYAVDVAIFWPMRAAGLPGNFGLQEHSSRNVRDFAV